MKKFIFIVLAAIALSCGDRNKQSDESNVQNADSIEQVESDATNIDAANAADTSSTWDQDRDRYDRDSVQ